MNDLIKKSVEELKKIEEESRAELFALRFQSAMGNLEKPHRIGKLKKQIARILTILSVRKNAGENIAINVKVNLNETYAKIEKESQEFSKQRKAKIDLMMAEQQSPELKVPSLIDLPLNDAIGLKEKSVFSITEQSNVLDEQKIPVSLNKPAVVKKYSNKKVFEEEKPETLKESTSDTKKSPIVKKVVAKENKIDKHPTLKPLIKEKYVTKKTITKIKKTPNNKTTLTVKLPTSDKTDIEVKKETKKTESNNTNKKTTEINSKEKLSAIKSFVVMDDITKDSGSGVKIDLELKEKDLNTKDYNYGINLKENHYKILTSGKTTKKSVKKQLRKRQEINNGNK